MRLLRGALTLPLGVDINSERVCVVAADAHGDGFVVSETRSAEMPPANDGSLDLKIAEAIRNILASLKTRERRAILAAPPSEVVTRTFRVPPGMRRSEADRAAALEADTIVDWPTSERLVALDRIPGRSDEMLLSIARCSVVERVIAIARAGGLKPVAVDVPAARDPGCRRDS